MIFDIWENKKIKNERGFNIYLVTYILMSTYIEK